MVAAAAAPVNPAGHPEFGDGTVNAEGAPALFVSTLRERLGEVMPAYRHFALTLAKRSTFGVDHPLERGLLGACAACYTAGEVIRDASGAPVYDEAGVEKRQHLHSVQADGCMTGVRFAKSAPCRDAAGSAPPFVERVLPIDDAEGARFRPGDTNIPGRGIRELSDAIDRHVGKERQAAPHKSAAAASTAASGAAAAAATAAAAEAAAAAVEGTDPSGPAAGAFGGSAATAAAPTAAAAASGAAAAASGAATAASSVAAASRATTTAARCCNNFDAVDAPASGGAKKSLFDTFGFFGMFCRHRILLLGCNMFSGERRAYLTCLLWVFLSIHKLIIDNIEYDIGPCQWLPWFVLFLLLEGDKDVPDAVKQLLRACLSEVQAPLMRFHFYCHRVLCQATFDGWLMPGTAVQHGEGTEMKWSKFNKLATRLKGMGKAARYGEIDYWWHCENMRQDVRRRPPAHHVCNRHTASPFFLPLF